jgi:4-hydroxythreonine-4-phosphate dehydrogenase
VERIGALDEAERAFGSALPVLHRPHGVHVTPGVADAASARAIIGWIEEAVALCLSGAASGLVTAPIAKAPLYAAGFGFPGHTEFLAELTRDAPVSGPRGPVMMLTARDLRVALATIHIPLSKVPSSLSHDSVVHTGLVLHHALKRDFGVARPRIALAGLNPHAGESGTIGREEVEFLNPAARTLREAGVDCTDARPSDSLFHEEARARFDGVIGLYHDQALIPVKTLDFWGGVNVSLGLPIVRTSPDHGVGYDIAGKGVARPDSLIAAVRLADQMARHRAKDGGS